MSVGSYSQLTLILLLVIYCLIGQEVNANRERRQSANANTRMLPGNSNGIMPPNNVQFNPSNNQQQQSNNNLLPSSQGQGQPVRSRGFYSSPDFKPPSFTGDKPLGWFDTKYQNWVTNKDGRMNIADGKNGAPSSLQGKAIQSSREDGGAMFLEKVAAQYVSQGEKAYNFGKHNYRKDQASICYNRQSYNGYTFNKFYCPLPANTGMNPLNRYCCGIANYQYCCNEQEYYRNQAGGFDDGTDYGKHRDSRNRHHSRTHRTLAIILPIVGILVAAGAIAIVFLYYKKFRNPQNGVGKSPGVTRKTDSYSAVPQDSPVDKPIVPPRQHQTTTDEA